MSKHLLVVLGMALLSFQAAAGDTLKFCFQQEVLQKGCLTDNPVKALLVPGRKSLSVAPVKLNQDNLLDLIVQGDGGSGGHQIYIFFQVRPGFFILKGISFGYAVFIDFKNKDTASIVTQSQSGVCEQHFVRLDYENNSYEEKGSFDWSCIAEREALPRYKIEDLIGTWDHSSIKSGHEGNFMDMMVFLPRWQPGFVTVDENFKLVLTDL